MKFNPWKTWCLKSWGFQYHEKSMKIPHFTQLQYLMAFSWVFHSLGHDLKHFMGHETVKYSPDFHGFFHGKYPMKISLIYHENPVKKKKALEMPLISWEKMTRFSWVLSFHSWALTRWNRKLLLFYLLHQEMDARAKLINVHEQCMYLNPVVFDPLAGKEPINHGKNLPLWYEFKGKFKRKKVRFLQNKATLEFTTLSNIIVIADRSKMHQCP